MITKEQWMRLRQGSVIRYKRYDTWVLRTVLLGPADGIHSRKSSGGVVLLKWKHSQFDNPTTTYFWTDLKDKIEVTCMKITSGPATYPEIQRIQEMFGQEAMEKVEKRLQHTKDCWQKISKWQKARHPNFQ